MVSHKELEPQPSGWGSFFCFFPFFASPVVVFLRLNSYSYFLSATVIRLESALREPGAYWGPLRYPIKYLFSEVGFRWLVRHNGDMAYHLFTTTYTLATLALIFRVYR